SGAPRTVCMSPMIVAVAPPAVVIRRWTPRLRHLRYAGSSSGQSCPLHRFPYGPADSAAVVAERDEQIAGRGVERGERPLGGQQLGQLQGDDAVGDGPHLSGQI